MVCPAETPEGQACGLVKNLSLMTFVSVGSPSEDLVDELYANNVEALWEIDPSDIPKGTKIFVNGLWIGIHRNA